MLSAEGILLSSLLNNHDVLAARGFGITPAHFIGYQDEYNWLLNYAETYNAEPSWDAFREGFPHFPPASSHENTRSACDMVLKAFGKRSLTAAMNDAMELLGMGDLNNAYTTLVKAEPVRTSAKARRLLTDLTFMDDWDKDTTTIETPYRTLNRCTGGMRPGQLWYLAARPKNGKSAHMVNMVTRAMLDGCRVKFYSLEMSEAEVRARFHTVLARHYGYKGITLTGIRDRTVDTMTYKTFVGELQDRLVNTGGHLDIHTPKQGIVTPGVIATGANEYHLNVIDYIGLMRGEGGSRAVDDWRNLAGISNDLKLIANSHSTTVLAASQINREGDHGNEPPRLNNLAGSDALGQDGDVIVTMRSMAHDVATHCSIEGNRHGPSMRYYTRFDPNTGDFTECSAQEAEELELEQVH